MASNIGEDMIATEEENSNDSDVTNVSDISTIHIFPDQLDPEDQPSTSQKTVQSTIENECSNDGCQSPSKKRRLNDDSDEDDGMTCPICLDSWTNSGEHRICALKCGHLFGYKCITRWLDSEARKLCPTCKKKVNTYDIRHIYARKLIALDTTELTIMKTQLQMAQEEKNKVQMELTKNICKEHTLLQQIEDQKRTIEQLRSKILLQQQLGKRNFQGSSNQNEKRQVRLYRDKSIDLGKNSGCRVISANTSLDLVTVSIKSPNQFYTGFGIRKYNVSTYKATAFIGLHSATIRDMKFHKENPWILTAAMDKSSSVVNMNTNEKILSASCDSPIWSCCWDPDISPIFYVGTSRGSVFKYDMRNVSQQLDILEVPGDMSPVVSVQAVKRCTNSCSSVGILSCKLQSLWFFEHANSIYTSHPLPIEGPFSSLTYSNSTGHMLVSARPSEKYKQSRHLLSTLSKRDELITCSTVFTFHGGYNQKMLSRSHLLTNVNDFVAAYVEDTRSIDIWSVNSGKKAGYVHVSDYVLDFNSVQSANSTILLALTESKLEFFKFSN